MFLVSFLGSRWIIRQFAVIYRFESSALEKVSCDALEK